MTMIHEVDPDLWLDENFIRLSPEQKLVVLSLCLCDEITEEGLFLLSGPTTDDMARILGMTPSSFNSIVRGLMSPPFYLMSFVEKLSDLYIAIDIYKLGRYFPRFKKKVQ